MSFVFKVDTSDVRRIARGYRIGGKLVDTVIVRAVNRGGDAGLTVVRKQLVADTGISQNDTRRSKGLTKVLASTARPSYHVKAKSLYTPLGYFNPVQTASGVRANPWNRQMTFAGTFMLRMSNGYVGVFRRDATQARETRNSRDGRTYRARPIKELWGPSLAVEMLRNGIPEMFKRTAGEKAIARLPQEVMFELSKAMGNKKGR